MFQIIEAFEDKLSETDDCDKVKIAKEDTLKLIELALQKRIRDNMGEIVQFPTSPENYLSFCDLLEVVSHPERKLWHTFILQDQKDVLEKLHGPEGSLPLWKIRKSLKKRLNNQDKLASVQMEIKVTETNFQIVFLRIATTATTKIMQNGEKKLLCAKPTFLVYFPGEQYFYADSSVPNEQHCQVITLEHIVHIPICSDYFVS